MLVAAACGEPVDRVDPAECHVGAFFGECSVGEREPVLACIDRACRWYSDRTVPSTVTLVSSCPADDICCEDDWPFEDRDFDLLGLESSFYAFGVDPWDRRRAMSLEVMVVLDLEVPDEPIFGCSEPSTSLPGDPCVYGVGGYFAVRNDTLAFSGDTQWDFGEFPWFEIDEQDGQLRGRACLGDFTDSFSLHCVDPVAGSVGRPLCAIAGTIELDAWPDARAFRMTAMLEDGRTIDASGTLAP